MLLLRFIRLSIVTFTLLVLGLGAYFVVHIPFSDIKKLERGYVKIDYDKNNQVSYKIVSVKPDSWLPLSLINKNVYSAIQISEDWSFYDHSGIDFKELLNALVDSAVHGEKLRGASTITQQLVKNLFLSSERSFKRKIQEAFITLYLESVLSKNKILESYLNIIEYGDKTYGICNASKVYFKKHPFLLDAREGAFLASLLPNPKLYSSSFKNKKTSLFIEASVRNILNKMKIAKYINEDKLNEEVNKHFPWDDFL